MDPVSFAANIITYNFDLPSKAYANNLLMMVDGRWVIYGGDVNQDLIVDATDMQIVDNDANYATSGYLDDDCNGDGLMDGADMQIIENVATMAIHAITP